VADAAAVTPHHAVGATAALAAAQQRAAAAEERLADLKALLEDMCKDRDAWREQAQGRLLSAPGGEDELVEVAQDPRDVTAEAGRRKWR
jgi:hypothetical protein